MKSRRRLMVYIAATVAFLMEMVSETHRFTPTVYYGT